MIKMVTSTDFASVFKKFCKKCFHSSEIDTEWTEELCQNNQGYVFVQETLVVGVFLFTKLVRSLTIIKLAVLPSFTRQGIASQLLAQNIRVIYLHVRVSNTSAIEFYKKNGFKIIDTLENYFDFTNSTEDAYYMKKSR